MQPIILRRRRLGRGSTLGIQAASQQGIVPVRNWRARDRPTEAPSHIFRWGCTSSFDFPHEGSVVVNTARSIHWCNDKKQARIDMQEAGVPVPKTWDTGYFISQHFTDLGGNYVVRRRHHAQGRDLWHGNYEEAKLAIIQNRVIDGYVSEFIDKEHEYRVFVCQNRAVWMAKKTPGNPQDIAWNVNQGGRFDNVRWGQWPLQVVRAALQAAKVSGADFCGVDIMVNGDGRAYVLELNSAPSQTSPYRQQCVAKAFDYIVENGKEHFPDPSSYNHWSDVIHPAVHGGSDD